MEPGGKGAQDRFYSLNLNRNGQARNGVARNPDPEFRPGGFFPNPVWEMRHIKIFHGRGGNTLPRFRCLN
jgi:hypothetical protein